MSDELDIYSIYEQNLNFLVGAGASYGFLPTLALNIKKSDGICYTLETLAEELDDSKKDDLYSLLFMYYYRECIWTGLPRVPRVPYPPHRVEVINNYECFLSNVIKVLDKQKSSNKKCNIYTTNYDSCFEVASDNLMLDKTISFTVNDGSFGFQCREFHTKNFNNRIVHKGIFDRHSVSLPQINILHPHGSVYWKKHANGIEVEYGQTIYDIEFDASTLGVIESFKS